jgi:hypothetical protein
MKKNDTLEIVCEILYERNTYFKDDKGDVYTVAQGVHPPNSPIVSTKLYNSKKYYRKIEDNDKLKILYKRFEEYDKDNN